MRQIPPIPLGARACYDCHRIFMSEAEYVTETRQTSGPSHNDVGTFAGDFTPQLVCADRRVCQQYRKDHPGIPGSWVHEPSDYCPNCNQLLPKVEP